MHRTGSEGGTPETAISQLRICILAGTLGQGGAERQLVYMARALKALGVDVRVYCPYRGHYYQSVLEEANIPVICLGRSSIRAIWMIRLAAQLARFRPQIVQAAHFYMNLPVNILGRLVGSVCLASSRGEISREVRESVPWGIWGVRSAGTLVVNSRTSKDGAIRLGVSPEKLVLLSNVIDLKEFDRISAQKIEAVAPPNSISAIGVGTLCENKRFDLLIKAVASARREEPRLHGLLAGDGPARDDLNALAASLDLGEGFRFLGRRNDVPALLKQTNVLVLSSESEGCPNVVLEAMAARVPVITTPAGDAAELVKAANAGFVVAHNDISGMSARLAQLAQSRELRDELGSNGRQYVELRHDAGNLGATLLATYRIAAQNQNARLSLELLKPAESL